MMARDIIYFVRELCEDQDEFEFQIDLHSEIGAEVKIVERLCEVPANAVYFNGVLIVPNLLQ